jgi:hypothetical protein
MKFLVPNYSFLQNPWLGGYHLQIPVLSVLGPQLKLLNPPTNKIPGHPTDSRSTSHQKLAPVALVSAMDGEPLGLLATEMWVLQLQMQTVHRGNGVLSLYSAAPSVYIECGTSQPSVCSRVHITLWMMLYELWLLSPMQSFSSHVSWLRGSSRGIHRPCRWEVINERIQWVSEHCLSTALSRWPKCRVYISPLLSCFYTKIKLYWQPWVSEVVSTVLPLFSCLSYMITRCVGNPELVKLSALCSLSSHACHTWSHAVLVTLS